MWANLELVSTRDTNSTRGSDSQEFTEESLFTHNRSERLWSADSVPSSWSALFILSAAAGLPSLSISSWSLPAEAAGAFGNRAGSGVQGQLDNRPLQQEWGTVVSECQQCFRHSDWQCAGLMRSVWIMNEPADIPHNSLSSMKHNTKAQSLQGFTGANNWLCIQPHISNSHTVLPNLQHSSWVLKQQKFFLLFVSTKKMCMRSMHELGGFANLATFFKQLFLKHDAATTCNLHVSSVWKWVLLIGLRPYDLDMLQSVDVQLSLYHHLHMLACSCMCSCYVWVINVLLHTNLQHGYANNAAHQVQTYGFYKASWDNLNCNCS